MDLEPKQSSISEEIVKEDKKLWHRLPLVFRNFPANYFLFFSIIFFLSSLIHRNNESSVYLLVIGVILITWSFLLRKRRLKDLKDKEIPSRKVIFLFLSLIISIYSIIWVTANLWIFPSLLWFCGISIWADGGIHPTFQAEDQCVWTSNPVKKNEPDEYKRCVEDSDCILEDSCGSCGGKDFPVNKNWHTFCNDEYKKHLRLLSDSEWCFPLFRHQTSCHKGYCIIDDEP